MKTKMSISLMSFSPAALVTSILLALVISVPVAVEAVPITLTLDNPNQTVATPASGTLTIGFTGTVTLDPGFLVNANLDPAGNSTFTHFLTTTLAPGFLNFLNTSTGSYSGLLFSVAVPFGTLPDLYLITSGGGFSYLALDGFNPQTGGDAFARESFSVLVTNGVSVPESHPGALFLGVALAGLFAARRFLVARRA